MKKLFIALAFVFAGATTVSAQEANENPNAPVISFEKTTHDFGTIEQNGNGTYAFVYTNEGKEPLQITNAKGSCGCTVPKWSRDPLPPGETAEIEVKYDTKRVGPFNKSVTITSNASEATKVIRIKGTVKKEETAGTPTKTPSMAAPVAPKK